MKKLGSMLQTSTEINDFHVFGIKLYFDVLNCTAIHFGQTIKSMSSAYPKYYPNLVSNNKIGQHDQTKDVITLHSPTNCLIVDKS